MGMTVEHLLTELQKPENESEIKHLAHLKNLTNLDELKEKRGIGGFFSRIMLSFMRKHMEAFVALSECETAEDIAAFKQTAHFDKIKSSTVGEDLDLKDLSQLEELQSLRDI